MTLTLAIALLFPAGTPVAPANAQAPAATVQERASAHPKPATERLVKDTPRTTAGGATFTVPAGWSIVVNGPVVVLAPPEGDTRLGVVETSPTEPTRPSPRHGRQSSPERSGR